jgi:actin-related protein 3
LDFFTGDEALSPAAANYFVKYPVRHGLVEDWDLMERFWFEEILKANPNVQITPTPCN